MKSYHSSRRTSAVALLVIIFYSVFSTLLRHSQVNKYDKRLFGVTAEEMPLEKLNSKSDSSMKNTDTIARIAYSFCAYKGDMYAIPAVIAAIFDSDNAYYVQLDAQVTPYEVSELEDLIVKHVLDWNHGNPSNHGCLDGECVKSTIVVTTNEFSTTYRGISEPLAVIDSLQSLLELNSEWDFFINLTPLDYPLGMQMDIRKYLGSAGNHSFVGHFATWAQQHTSGLMFDRWHDLWFDPSLLHHRDKDATGKEGLHQIQGARIPDMYADSDMMKLMQCEAYFILHRSFCDYVVASPLSRRVTALLAHSDTSSEKYLATVLYNSKQFSHCPSNMRGNTMAGGPYVKNADGSLCQGCSIGTTNTSEEYTLELLSQTGLLFFRKFPQLWESDQRVSSDLADQYASESYRVALREKIRDESSEYSKTWRLTVKEKLESIFPHCQVGNPFTST